MAEVARKYTIFRPFSLFPCPAYCDPIRLGGRGSTLCQYCDVGIYSLITCKFSPRWYHRAARMSHSSRIVGDVPECARLPRIAGAYRRRIYLVHNRCVRKGIVSSKYH